MATNGEKTEVYEFGSYRLDTAEHQLSRAGLNVPLPPKAFELLVLLVRENGHLLEKKALMESLWPDSFVEEANLNHHIWTLRKALGESNDALPFIETVPKKGYRFAVSVKELSNAGEELVIEQHTLTRIVTEAEEQIDDGDVASQPAVLALPATNKHGWLRSRSRIAIAAPCLMVVAVLLAFYHPWTARKSNAATPAAAAAALKSIAVLPFKLIGAQGKEDEYLGLGLSDALITKLGNEHRIIVRPTSAVRRYTDANQDPATIGRQQQVDAVLDGSVQTIGDRLRLTVQLVRVADGVTIWSGHFDERFSDIFSVQDSISDKVACDLITRVCGPENRNSRETVNVEAYQAYLKGRYFWNKRTDEGVKRAIEYFNQAIAAEPTYARAYSGLADSYLLVGDLRSRKETNDKAKTAALRALELDETLAEAHTSLGLIAMNCDWDWAASEKEYKRALELNPNYPTAHHWYAEYLNAVGRSDQALAEIDRARELDPLSIIINSDKGKILYYARRYDEAIAQLKLTLEMDPDFGQALSLLAVTYQAKGMNDQALAELEEIAARAPSTSYWKLVDLCAIALISGKRGEAQEITNQLKRLSHRDDFNPFALALLYTALDDKDQAFVWLEKAYAGRSNSLTSLKLNPMFDSLRSDPRYTDLMQRVGLSPN